MPSQTEQKFLEKCKVECQACFIYINAKHIFNGDEDKETWPISFQYRHQSSTINRSEML